MSHNSENRIISARVSTVLNISFIDKTLFTLETSIPLVSITQSLKCLPKSLTVTMSNLLSIYSNLEKNEPLNHIKPCSF